MNPRPTFLSWVHETVAVRPTSDRVLLVEGRGSRAWLHSLLTADLRDASRGPARYALLLNPKGGIVSDAWVVESAARSSEGLALVVPLTTADLVHQMLDRYLITEALAVSIEPTLRVITVQGPRAADAVARVASSHTTYPCARLHPDGIDVWARADVAENAVDQLSQEAALLGGGVLEAEDWVRAHVVLAVPRATVDFDESSSPHEAGLDERAVSMSKGCYPGQEVVAKQHRRSGLSKRLTQLVLDSADGVHSGAVVRDVDGAEVGRVTSAAGGPGGGFALAVLLPPFAEPGMSLTVAERRAHVRRVVGKADSPAIRAAG
jgi:folate-binding protein YgfZ